MLKWYGHQKQLMSLYSIIRMESQIKGMIATITFVLLVILVFNLYQELSETELGKNPNSKEVIEAGKEATSILFNGYFIASAISGVIGTITLILWIKNKYLDY